MAQYSLICRKNLSIAGLGGKMTWTECIDIRAHSDLEAMDVIAVFRNLSLSRAESNLADISLYRNRSVVNDFSVRLTWHGEAPEREKSALGCQLAEAFSKMGWINHAVWIQETNLLLLNGKLADGNKGN